MKQIRVSMTFTADERDHLEELSKKVGMAPTATAKLAYRYGVQSLDMAFDPKMIGIFEAQMKIMEDIAKNEQKKV